MPAGVRCPGSRRDVAWDPTIRRMGERAICPCCGRAVAVSPQGFIWSHRKQRESMRGAV